MRIVIVGGGPVGLMAACELRLYGIETVVLERRTDIDPTIKAGAISGRGVDALDRRGLADRVLAAGGERVRAFQALMRESGIKGHFSGLFVLRESSEPGGNRWLTDLIGGVAVRYDLGSELDAIGRFCQDIQVDTAESALRLTELQRTGRGQLLVLDAPGSSDAAQWLKAGSAWGDRVEVTVGTSPDAPSRAVLVRPDGYTAWTAESEQPLEEALEAWFGPAA